MYSDAGDNKAIMGARGRLEYYRRILVNEDIKSDDKGNVCYIHTVKGSKSMVKNVSELAALFGDDEVVMILLREGCSLMGCIKNACIGGHFDLVKALMKIRSDKNDMEIVDGELKTDILERIEDDLSDYTIDEMMDSVTEYAPDEIKCNTQRKILLFKLLGEFGDTETLEKELDAMRGEKLVKGSLMAGINKGRDPEKTQLRQEYIPDPEEMTRFNEATTTLILDNGHYDVFKFMVSKGLIKQNILDDFAPRVGWEVAEMFETIDQMDMMFIRSGACNRGDIETLNWLRRRSFTPKNSCALQSAHGGNLESLRWAVEINNDDITDEVFERACRYGKNVDCVAYILDRGHKINIKKGIKVAQKSGNEAIVQYLINRYSGR
jgi:hypothetical protein